MNREDLAHHSESLADTRIHERHLLGVLKGNISPTSVSVPEKLDVLLVELFTEMSAMGLLDEYELGN